MPFTNAGNTTSRELDIMSVASDINTGDGLQFHCLKKRLDECLVAGVKIVPYMAGYTICLFETLLVGLLVILKT